MPDPVQGAPARFWPHGKDQPEAATIRTVHSNDLVDLDVTDTDGLVRVESLVPFRQPGTKPATEEALRGWPSPFCEPQ